jgi:alanine racemase
LLAHIERLTPVLEWKTRIAVLKDLVKGEAIGYGRTYRAKKKEKIAILPIGYADGYPRLLSNRGFVLIRGKKCPVRGRISMDLTAVDVSQVASVKEGDPAILIGRDSKYAISAWEIAFGAETIPYEVLCGISTRVPRIYLE